MQNTINTPAIFKSKYSFSSSRKAKGWIMEFNDVRWEFRTKREAEAASKFALQLADQNQNLNDFDGEILCYNQQGNQFPEMRKVLFEGKGLFRIVTPHIHMEDDEIIEIDELLEREIL